MELYKEWLNKTENGDQQFFSLYLEQEKDAYAKILSENTQNIKGKVSDLCKEYSMEGVVFAGFLEGINTSLEKELDLEGLTEESEVDFTIDFEKLYYNMLNAKAQWLYDLPEWDEILSKETRSEIKKQYNKDHIAVSNKVGRNDPCPCGSGKKYKKCCGK